MDYESNDISSLKESYMEVIRNLQKEQEDIGETWGTYQEEYTMAKYSEDDVDKIKTEFETKIEKLEEKNDNLESMIMSEMNKSLFTIIKERFINWLI